MSSPAGANGPDSAVPYPLLQPGDPPPFEIVNPDGAARLVLIADHAGRAIPRALGSLGLGPAELARHIAWDIGIGDVTRRLARQLGAPALLCGYSRLVIDCNRRLGDPTSIAQESDGIAVPGTRGLAAAERARRVEALFQP
ncbi:MAG TPA: N-formylglutamate amidohydrolase, partial [Dongiaceae bacterium]|nr:N-formylglutamate amidohydrolase [Dongiaceae bacterium]